MLQNDTHLPALGAVQRALVAQAGHVVGHPVVDLRQGHVPVWHAANRLADQLGVRRVAGLVARPLASRDHGGSGSRRRRS